MRSSAGRSPRRDDGDALRLSDLRVARRAHFQSVKLIKSRTVPLLLFTACASPAASNDAAATDATHSDAPVTAPGLDVLYSGPIASARIANWDAANPRPVVATAVRTATQIQTITMVQIAADGTIAPLATDTLSVWGWPSQSAGAPTVVYDGPVTGGMITDWNAAMRRPFVVMARQGSTWTASMLEIHTDGSFGSLVADRVVVYGWNDGALGTPHVTYEGTFDSTTRLPTWDPTTVSPHIAMISQSGSGSRFVSMLEIHADGTFGPLVADSLTLWTF